ncbi:MAG: penicillin-binding protein 2 [bacterium]
MKRLPFRLNNPVPVRFRGFRPRLALVVALVALLGLAIVWRAVDLQVIQHEKLARMARKQSRRVIRVKGRRGAIHDRYGGRLALSLKAKSFYAHPSLLKDPQRAALELGKALSLPVDDLERRLSSDNPFVWLKRQVTPREAAAAQGLAIKGVGSTLEYRRIYPSRSTAAALIGFTGIDSQGLEGLEYAYDSYLRGQERIQVVDVDALGRTFLRSGRGLPTGGGSITLTLHPGIQHIAEKELERAVRLSEAKVGVVLVMHTPTGEILALAQAPGFNPNDFRNYDKSAFFNRAVTSGYEPGSTFKVITAAAALESATAKPGDLFFCEEGSFVHYDSVIHDTKPYGWLSMDRVIQVSSNICAAKIGMAVPVPFFHDLIGRLGFGRRLGLFNAPDGRRLAGEAEGYVLPAAKWTPVDHAAISFGHGILVSPLQLTVAVNTIANGGRMMKPILVKEIRSPSGEVIERNRPTVVARVLSPRTAATVRDFMLGVVSEKGTGRRAAMASYQVAGKTGTTEKYDIKARGYSKTRHIASFVRFVPAYRPVLTILALVEEPQKGRYGGVVAAPVFRRIAAAALPLLGVWPGGEVRRLAGGAGGSGLAAK